MFRKLEPWLTKVSPKLVGTIGLIVSPPFFFGCGTDIVKHPMLLKHPQESIASGSVNTEKGALLIWFALDSSYLQVSLVERYQQHLETIVAEFKKAYPNIQVSYEFIASEDVVKRYLQDIDHGFGPDLVLTKNLHLGHLLQSHALAPIDRQAINLEHFRQDALSQMEYQGKLYAIPVTLGTQTLCYNKQKVKEVPTSLEEITQFASQGYSFGITSNFGDTLWGLGAFDGKIFNRDGQVILDQGPWSQWIEFLVEIKNKPNVVFIPTSLATNQAFSEGKLAYITCWSLAIPELITAIGQENLGIAPLPGFPGHPSSPTLTGFSFVFNPVSNAKQQNLALKVATFFTNIEQQQQWILESRSAIPVNTRVQIPANIFTIQGQLKKQSLTANSYGIKEIEKIEFMLNMGERFYVSVLSGAITAQQAALEITQQTNQYFENQVNNESKHK
jgi:ABC-type glycerol-3-phosphate transport system substrate-binding protein